MKTSFILLFILTIVIYSFLYRKKSKHKRNINTSKKIIKRINEFKYNGQKLNYLKKIDPYVFEEILLTAFESKGYKIERSKRYSGDGGIDGKIYDKQNNEIFLQAKRYKGHINLQHLKDFEKLINQKGVQGYFIHTGKTGKFSKEFTNNARLNIIPINIYVKHLNITI